MNDDCDFDLVVANDYAPPQFDLKNINNAHIADIDNNNNSTTGTPTSSASALSTPPSSPLLHVLSDVDMEKLQKELHVERSRAAKAEKRYQNAKQLLRYFSKEKKNAEEAEKRRRLEENERDRSQQLCDVYKRQCLDLQQLLAASTERHTTEEGALQNKILNLQRQLELLIDGNKDRETKLTAVRAENAERDQRIKMLTTQLHRVADEKHTVLDENASLRLLIKDLRGAEERCRDTEKLMAIIKSDAQKEIEKQKRLTAQQSDEIAYLKRLLYGPSSTNATTTTPSPAPNRRLLV